MRLEIKQRAFKADEITYLDRKAIQLDRMLLRLFELLRFDGRTAIRRRKRVIDVQSLVNLMQRDTERFQGFDTREDVARAWLLNDLFEIMNRGKGEGEMVVGPRPFHLNAFKLVNPKAADDFGASMQIWALLFYADRPLLGQLKEFFGRGLDQTLDRYDKTTPLDLETLAILGLVETGNVTVDHVTTPPPEPIRPLCVGQGRILAEDLRRLLAYENVVPRHILAEYVRTILGLHLALYMLRLFKLLPAWIAQAQHGKACSSCPFEEGTDQQIEACPHQFEIVVDLTDNPVSPTADLSRASAASHLDGISAYVRAVTFLNRLKDFAAMQTKSGKRQQQSTVEELLALLANPPADMDGFFNARITDALTSDDEEEEEDPIVKAILNVPSLTPLEQYVEMVCFDRMKSERKHLITLLDALTQKNKPGGFLKQSAGARSTRWFVFGSNLLETLVQIAVLTRDPSGRLSSNNLLVDDFVKWLRTRYGFVIYAPLHRTVPPEEQVIWQKNEQALRERLHQIGFFTSLSDAYNSQTIRPRYMVRFND